MKGFEGSQYTHANQMAFSCFKVDDQKCISSVSPNTSEISNKAKFNITVISPGSHLSSQRKRFLTGRNIPC